MSKRILSLVLAVVLAVGCSVGAAASTPATIENMTLEERINRLELSPQPRPDWESVLNWYDFSRVERINNDKSLSTYEKMKAVYLDIAQETQGFSCTSHAKLLGAAYEMLGLKVYGASGGVKSKTGASSSSRMGFVQEGYTAHSWIAVEIDGIPDVVTHKVTGSYDGNSFEYEVSKIKDTDVSLSAELNGEILFFDLNLYSTHGMDFDSCFAVPPTDTSLYIAVGVGNYYG